MKKGEKHIKHLCRLKNIEQEQLDKLYYDIPHNCVDCIHDCKGDFGNIDNCQNREIRENLNEIIDMVNLQKVSLKNFCKTYSEKFGCELKLNILLEMLKAEKILDYKYYTILATRLHIKKYDEFAIYESRFTENDIENNTPQMEGNI
jgi:hypothetical protein